MHEVFILINFLQCVHRLKHFLLFFVLLIAALKQHTDWSLVYIVIIYILVLEDGK